MITLEILNTRQGENKIFIQDTSEDERKKLAAHVTKMLHDGFEIFLTETDKELAHRIAGYDETRNEWLIHSPPREPIPTPIKDASATKRRRKERYTRKPAGTTTAVGVALTAGG